LGLKLFMEDNMAYLPDSTIRSLCFKKVLDGNNKWKSVPCENALIKPFIERTVINGCSGGLSSHGYDITIAEDAVLKPGDFLLASSIEYFQMPNNLVGTVHDKSTMVRQGLHVHNTVIEAGWYGFLTLELKNQHPWWKRLFQFVGMYKKCTLHIKRGSPIAQVMFALTVTPCEQPYSGKYQNQAAGPQQARKEIGNVPVGNHTQEYPSVWEDFL